MTVASIAQLTKLPAEILRLHLSSRHLVSTGTKSAMARRLYNSIHLSAASSSTPATSTTQSSTTPATSTVQPTTTLLPPQYIATIPPRSVASFTTPGTSELASLVNQFLCHATTTQAPAILSPASIDGNADAQTITNQHQQTPPVQQILPAQHASPH